MWQMALMGAGMIAGQISTESGIKTNAKISSLQAKIQESQGITQELTNFTNWMKQEESIVGQQMAYAGASGMDSRSSVFQDSLLEYEKAQQGAVNTMEDNINDIKMASAANLAGIQYQAASQISTSRISTLTQMGMAAFNYGGSSASAGSTGTAGATTGSFGNTSLKLNYFG